MTQGLKLKPDFWDNSPIIGAGVHEGINFKRKWKLIVSLAIFMVLVPLVVMMLIDASLTRETINEQVTLSMTHLAVATAASLSEMIKQSDDDEMVSTSLSAKSLHPRMTALLNRLLNHLDFKDSTDIFILNDHGVRITGSSFSNQTAMFAPDRTTGSTTGKVSGLWVNQQRAVAVWARIPQTSLYLTVMKSEPDFRNLYFAPRLRLAGYLVASILLIIVSILGTTTYLVSRIYSADKKRLDALHHAESANKLAAIGRLASGVAHEINNPLAIINEKNGLLTDILSAQDNDEQQQKLLGIASDVNSAVRRCGRITKRLLDFARHLEPSIERVNVKEIVENIISFYLKEAERQNIRIRMDFPNQIPELETDKGSLQQIFLNLIENAFDALKNGGELNITAGVEDNYLKVIVADTGIGIPKDEHHKIFEPFYSSKSERWKTGLGLSITYGLIKEINADITVDSSVGKGAQFTLTLPLAANCENQ
jgi:two-component system NtrC family sensor kinase